MTYLGDPISQLDGSVFAHSNCVLASAAMVGDCSSLGYWRSKPARLRTLTGDLSGGVTYNQAAAAVKKDSNNETVLTVLYWAPQNSTTSTLDNILDAPRVTVISIDASVTRYTPFRTGTYTGGHSVVVGAKRTATITRSDGTTYKQKQAYVMDPGHTTAKWVWWPWSLLIKAATARAGAGKIHVMYSRDLGNVSRVAASSGVIHSSTVVSTTNHVGTFVAGKAYTVLETVRGSKYTLDGRTLTGWSRIGVGKYTVAKIR